MPGAQRVGCMQCQGDMTIMEFHDLNHPESREKTAAANAQWFDPRVDRNMLRTPDRMIHVFSTSAREFRIDRAPLWSKLVLRGCKPGERYVTVAHVPDPLIQAVHNTENGRQRGEAHDGWRAAVDLLNPNNPTNDPDWNPGPEMAAFFGTSAGADLFAQGLFLSLNEVPTEQEIAKAEARRGKRSEALIAHADSLESTSPKELMEFLNGPDGMDLRMALDFFGEERAYHKKRKASRLCPNCGESIASGVGFHKSAALGVICVLDWQKAVDAGVKSKSDVPQGKEWWPSPGADAPDGAEADATATAKPAKKPAAKKAAGKAA
jgi:hypothetical protein